MGSGQPVIHAMLAKTIVYKQPSSMRSVFLLFSLLVLMGCSSESGESQQSIRARDALRDALEAREPADIRSARQTCKHLRDGPGVHDEVDVGISNYEACLGQMANLTHPANPQLCDLAKSKMSASGECILGE